MKNLFKYAIAISLIVLFGFIFAGDGIFEYEAISWDSDADTIVAADRFDTTATFELFREQKIQGRRTMEVGMVYPSEISFLVQATLFDAVSNDSIALIYYLDLSNDETYWYQYGELIDLTSQSYAAGESNVSSIILGLLDNNLISSIAITEAVTFTYDSTLNEAIIAEPWADGAIDSVAHVTSSANTRAETYTYASETDFPKFKYGRLRTVMAADVADTISTVQQITRYFR